MNYQYIQPKVQLVWITPKAEEVMIEIARVSSTRENKRENIGKLLRYLVRHKHWSPFDMVDMCVQIETSTVIAKQILRHQSFKFQEFSQRYAKVHNAVLVRPRSQDTKNKQNSIDDLDSITHEEFLEDLADLNQQQFGLYNKWLNKGVAKESARFFLGNNALSSLYMKGSLRSWIHYLQARLANETQFEHREIAEKIRDNIFIKQFPVTHNALFNEPI